MNGEARPFAALRRGARLFCNARFLARFARYAAFCIARLLARFLHSDLPVLRSGLTPSPSACSQNSRLLSWGLPTEISMKGGARPFAALRLSVSLAS